jgi:hypothetical protein
MTAPARLGRELPVTMGMGSGIAFFVSVQAIVLIITALTFGVIFGLMMANLRGGGGGPAGAAIPISLIFMAIAGVGGFLAAIVGLLIFGAIVHGVLRLGGPTRGGIDRTIAAVGFGIGPSILAAVPLIGTYCLGTVGGLWAIVSTILVVSGAQAVSGLRATVAVLSPVAILIAAYLVLLFTVFTLGGGVAPAPGVAGPTAFAAGPGMMGDPAFVFHGVSPLPDPATAAAMMPQVFDANAEMIDLVGNGYAGWCQAGELILRRDDGGMLHAALSPDATSLTIVFTDDGINGGSTSVSPVDASDIRDAIVDRLGDGNLVGEDLTVESMQAWIDLTLRGTDGP